MKTFINTQFTTNAEGSNVPDLDGLEADGEVRYSLYDRGDGTCLVRVTGPKAKVSSAVSAQNVTEVTDQDVIDDTTVPFGQGMYALENLDVPDAEVDAELNQFAADEVLDDDEMNRAYIIHNWTKGPLEKSDREDILQEYGATDVRELLYVTNAATRNAIVQEYSIGSLPNSLPTSTLARSVIQNQTVGRQVLQDQEVTALNKVAIAKGRTRANELPKHTRADDTGELSAVSINMLGGANSEHQKMLDYVMDRNSQGPPWSLADNAPGKGKPQ